jgi:hypothetical protein
MKRLPFASRIACDLPFLRFDHAVWSSPQQAAARRENAVGFPLSGMALSAERQHAIFRRSSNLGWRTDRGRRINRDRHGRASARRDQKPVLGQSISFASRWPPFSRQVPDHSPSSRETLMNPATRVAPETRRTSKATLRVLLLLRLRARRGYGHAQYSVALRGGAMNVYRGHTALVGRHLFPRLRTIATALLLLLPIVASPAQAAPAQAAPETAAARASTAHVYLLRGVLNVFSLGLDQIAARLQAQGIQVTISNYVFWSSLANEAAAEYQSGKTKTIILVGHSSGATSLPDMVARLDQLGVPVKLAIGLDSVFHTSLSGRVGRYVNFYVANGAGTPVERTRGFQGTLENVNVASVPGVGHLTIEKNQIMQQKVIGEIDAVVFGRPSPASPARRRQQPSEASAATAAPRAAASAAAARN